jgi:D-glycero-D-manno-heptose 1,7-bisphosphate phosphatase
MQAQLRRYVLLDRDGVISRRIPNGHAKCWEHFEFLPRALEALHLLAANHYAGILIARQPCGGSERPSASELDAITRRLLLEVALSGGHIAQVYYCRHRDEDRCNCYKPTVGLIARARADFGFRVEETHFIGEQEFVLQAAAAAACPCIRIQRDAFLHTPARCEESHRVVSNLYEAAEYVLAASLVVGHEETKNFLLKPREWNGSSQLSLLAVR